MSHTGDMGIARAIHRDCSTFLVSAATKKGGVNQVAGRIKFTVRAALSCSPTPPPTAEDLLFQKKLGELVEQMD